MPTYDEAMQALRAADAAGNVEDARRLAGIAAGLKGQTPPADPQAGDIPQIPGSPPPAPPAPSAPEPGMLAKAADFIGKPAAMARDVGNVALRSAATGLGSAVGGLGGGISWLLDQLTTGPKSDATVGSGADRGAAAAQAVLDKLGSKVSPETADKLRELADSPEMQSLYGMPALGPEARGFMASLKTGLGEAKTAGRVIAADTKAGLAPAVSRVTGKEAAQTAENLRTSASTLAAGRSDEARAAAEAAKKAGMSPEEADRAAQAADEHLADVEKVGKAMDDAMLAQPRMPKDQFGALVRGAADALHDKLSKARMEQSGYAAAIQADAATPVPTKGVLDLIAKHEEGIANPNIRTALETIKGELKPEGLPLKSADSLRKYLDAIIETKQIRAANGALAADKETLSVVRDIRRSLVESMDTASPALKTARAKWAELSRGGLDRLEGKGDLKPTLAEDAISGERKMTDAQVAGHVIRRANAGSDSLAMLVKDDPSLKESARLYYAGELFGKDTPPTVAQLQTFLKTNERSLKQTGLYDEFKTMANAKRARDHALEEAKGGVKAAKQEVTAAGQRARTAEAQQKIADKFSTFRTEIETAPAADVPRRVKSLGKSLVDEGLITQDEYAGLIRDADAASASAKSSADSRKLLLKVAAMLGVAGLGGEALKHGLNP